MKFTILIACFLIPSSATFGGGDIPQSRPLRCYGPPDPVDPPPPEPKRPRPHSAQEERSFLPHKILYLIDNTMQQEDYAKLQMATDYANERLSKLVKARKVADVRYQQCSPCRGMPFPPEYVLPCSPTTEESSPSDEIAKQNEADYTLVVRVLVRNQGVVATNFTDSCHHPDAIAYANTCPNGVDADNGPHHGYFYFCIKPSTKSDSSIRGTVLHETLHILMPYALSGVLGSNINCYGRDHCKDKTWKEVKRQALNEQGQAVGINVGMAITPFIREAAKNHFGCDTAEGAEMTFDIINKNTMEIRIDHAHWSQHLFPDEILAPFEGAARARFSNLTLSALASHDKWYRVDQSQAEPLISSKPTKEFACEVAGEKSCFDILKERQRLNEIKFMPPYCDARKGADRVIVSQCSPDHQRQWSCANLGPSGCSYLTDSAYDNIACANTTAVRQESLSARFSTTFGPGTICVTVTDIRWDRDTTNALCVHHECLADSLLLKFKWNKANGSECYITCAKSQSNQLLTVDWCSTGQRQATIICPDYDQVCNKETSATTTTATSTSTTITSPTTASRAPTTTTSVPTTTSTVSKTTSTSPATTTSVPKTASTVSTATSAVVTSKTTMTSTTSSVPKFTAQETVSPPRDASSTSSSPGSQSTTMQHSSSRAAVPNPLSASTIPLLILSAYGFF